MAARTNDASIEKSTAWVALVAAAVGVFPGALSALVCWSGLQSENAELRRNLADAKSTLENRDAELERRLNDLRERHAKEVAANQEQMTALEQRLDQADAEQEAIRRYVMSLTEQKNDEPAAEEAVVDSGRESQSVSREKSDGDWREVLAGVFLCCVAGVGVAVYCVIEPKFTNPFTRYK